MDVVDQATRSRMMSGIKSKNTTPEIIVRKFLHAHGYRFRLHRADLPGKPDIVLPRQRTCIFVNGCFWHRHAGCKYTYTPKSRLDFWLPKFAKNIERDRINQQALQALGWRTVVIWECYTKNLDLLRAEMSAALGVDF
ncbi:DNA mismatch endonuclease Vsr [Pseudomonas sp. REP124]|uniref:very short patch repair endonuclease n=1 Tax=Pseudomonas sp. REP124 TaxID=2875731 RepID=UPI001CCA966D|nr:DNA mismatch endonuclease Vsr [Pseudomonas sp. REP124]MBZ9784276.1 DNA mismatch endonuclease Vsr [Pseudomonas sp. REP124]